jgi:hypothetical protein
VGLQEARDGALDNPALYFEDATELAKRMARLVDTISSLKGTSGNLNFQLQKWQC